MNFKLLGQTDLIKHNYIYRLNIKKGSVAGIPPELSTLLLVSINQKPPYDITIGILNTKLWSENMLSAKDEKNEFGYLKSKLNAVKHHMIIPSRIDI